MTIQTKYKVIYILIICHLSRFITIKQFNFKKAYWDKAIFSLCEDLLYTNTYTHLISKLMDLNEILKSDARKYEWYLKYIKHIDTYISRNMLNFKYYLKNLKWVIVIMPAHKICVTQGYTIIIYTICRMMNYVNEDGNVVSIIMVYQDINFIMISELICSNVF